MSEYGFEYGDPEVNAAAGLTEQQPTGAEPKWFRERMDKVSDEIKALRAENDRLKAERRRTEVEKTLTAKGYAPGASALFAGEPNQLDEWLTQHGSALAKAAAAPEGEQEQAPAGPPASTVPADGQEQMQRMAEAGAQGAAPPQGSDKEQAAAIKAIDTLEDYAKFMASHGNPFNFTS